VCCWRCSTISAPTRTINLLLSPITHWWLGLPVLLGVPILFGVLRKELSLADGFPGAGKRWKSCPFLDWVQIATFLVFLTFYIPCVSTFAVMLRTIGCASGLVLGRALRVAVALADRRRRSPAAGTLASVASLTGPEDWRRPVRRWSTCWSQLSAATASATACPCD
jgi:hypothetical protein